jgi:hypothetical protein
VSNESPRAALDQIDATASRLLVLFSLGILASLMLGEHSPVTAALEMLSVFVGGIVLGSIHTMEVLMADEPLPVEEIGGVLFFYKGSAVIPRVLSGQDYFVWEAEEVQAVIAWLQAWMASLEPWQREAP